jgi:hypothetical protein
MDDSGGAIHEQSSWKAGRGLRAEGGGSGGGAGRLGVGGGEYRSGNTQSRGCPLNPLAAPVNRDAGPALLRRVMP